MFEKCRIISRPSALVANSDQLVGKNTVLLNQICYERRFANLGSKHINGVSTPDHSAQLQTGLTQGVANDKPHCLGINALTEPHANLIRRIGLNLRDWDTVCLEKPDD